MNLYIDIACLKASRRVAEDAYEVLGLLKVQHVAQVAKKARLLRAANMIKFGSSDVGTGLFSSILCHVHGQFIPPLPPKHEISSLVRLGGGEVVTQLNDLTETRIRGMTLVVIMEKIDCVQTLNAVVPTTSGQRIYYVGYDWVLDCISECTLKPLRHAF
jgi:hypothetical protein